MDVDLSTDLAAFPPLIDSLIDSEYDVAIGSRLKQGAQVQRGMKREIISRSYNLIIKLMFWNKFSDAQCGFKAITRRAVREIVPLIKDQAWFFDSELLLLAERMGYRIFEVPVKWADDPDSRVKIASRAPSWIAVCGESRAGINTLRAASLSVLVNTRSVVARPSLTLRIPSL